MFFHNSLSYLKANASLYSNVSQCYGAIKACNKFVSLIREHQQKTFVTLIRFYLLWMGEEVKVNPLTKENSWWKRFSDKVEQSSKNLLKMIFADIKANKKQQEIKETVAAVSYNLHEKHLQNLK